MSQFCVWRNYYRRKEKKRFENTLKYLEQTALVWLHSTIIIIIIKAFSRATKNNLRAVYHPHSPEIVIIKYFVAAAAAAVDDKCERQKIIKRERWI